jgi:uncharacterized integral membrane protein
MPNCRARAVLAGDRAGWVVYARRKRSETEEAVLAEEQIVEEGKEHTGIATVVSAAVIAVGLIAFVVQNGTEAEVTWLFLDGRWPLWVVIVISAVAGAALSEVLGWLIRRRRRSSD